MIVLRSLLGSLSASAYNNDRMCVTVLPCHLAGARKQVGITRRCRTHWVRAITGCAKVASAMVAIVNSLAIFIISHVTKFFCGRRRHQICRRRVARRQSERQVSLETIVLASPEDMDKTGRKAADLSPAESLKHQVAYSRCCY